MEAARSARCLACPVLARSDEAVDVPGFPRTPGLARRTRKKQMLEKDVQTGPIADSAGSVDSRDHRVSEFVYPPYVQTDDQRRRWELSAGIAEKLFGEDGVAQVWSATRAIYAGPLPT